MLEQDPRIRPLGICQVCGKPIYPWEKHVLNFHLSCLKPAGETATKLKFRTPTGGIIMVPKNYKFREIIEIKTKPR